MESTQLPPLEEILPHRPPMLLLDKVLRADAKQVVALRTFHPDEPFFKGHFPGEPIVPGVYLVEAMAQTMAYGQLLLAGPHRMLLAGVNQARFRKPVRPAEEVVFTLDLGPGKMGIYKAWGIATVGDERVAEAQLIGSLQKIVSN